MTDKYTWFHDEKRKHFFLKTNDTITHCYLLDLFKDLGGNEYNRWFLVNLFYESTENLTEVPAESDIDDHQLSLLRQVRFPISGVGWLYPRLIVDQLRHDEIWPELSNQPSLEPPSDFKWFHDNQRKHFFLKQDDRITHCYRLGRFLSGDNDYNHWWKVPIPRRPRDKRKKLIEVPRECEIDYQLHLLQSAKFPPAAWLFKRGYNRHPRYNQWSELHVLDEKPESWGGRGDYIVSADIDFEPAPFRHEDFGDEPPARILCAKQHACKAGTDEYTMWTEVLGQMKHLGYKNWDCGCKRNAATAIMTRNYHA